VDAGEGYEIVGGLRSDDVAGAGWRERASALGISELPLRPPVDDDEARSAHPERAAAG
jgi:hypothetical protein